MVAPDTDPEPRDQARVAAGDGWPSSRRRRPSPQVLRRRRVAALLVATALVAGVATVLDHGGAPPASSPGHFRGASALQKAPPGQTPGGAVVPTRVGLPVTTKTVTTTTVTTTTVTTTAAGTLPQTGAFPSATAPAFLQDMAALWAAVKSGVAARGLPAFFPEAAYLQVKAISGRASDWTDRLLAGYELDIGAAHKLLGPNAASAQLVGVEVPGGAAHWVSPGTCYNQIGYFEVPNSRMVYQVDGQTRSFGIASLISWRGEWYVVHLGAVNETPGVPAVDSPAVGPGYPAPANTC
ncbi:MAG: hypothetical protein ACYC1D_06800 [Acidimicrobiales bacterium]